MKGNNPYPPPGGKPQAAPPPQPEQVDRAHVDLHLHFHLGDDVREFFNFFKTEIKQMAEVLQDKIDQLTAQVARNTTVEASASALIKGFAAQLAAAVAAASAAGATPVQLQALTDLGASIGAADDDLSAAVAANTPADPGSGDTGGQTGDTPSA